MKLSIYITCKNVDYICSAWSLFIDLVLPITLTIIVIALSVYIIKRLFFDRLIRYLFWRKRQNVYYLSKDYKWTTPYTIAEIKKMIKKKKISGAHYIRVKEPDTWSPIVAIPHLNALLMKDKHKPTNNKGDESHGTK